MIDSLLDFMILDSLIRMMIDCLNNMISDLIQYLMFDSMKFENNEILKRVVWLFDKFASFECFVKLRSEDVVKTEIERSETLLKNDVNMQWLNHY